MSTRARITVISKEGESNSYSRGCDGYPSSVLDDFPKGNYTYEKLRQSLYLEDYFESMPDYFYDFDLQKNLVSIYHPEINKEIWTKGEMEFQGTIIEAIRKYVDEDYSEGVLSSIADIEQIWDVLKTVFVPLAKIAINELEYTLRPLFSYSAMNVELSSKNAAISRDHFSVDIDKPVEKTTNFPELNEAVSNAKSMWLTYSVATPKGANPTLRRFMIGYHLELLPDSYRLTGLNKDFKYGTYPNPAEIYEVLNVIMDNVTCILKNKIDGITYI